MDSVHETGLPFAALRAAFPEQQTLTMLHIGAESTLVAAGAANALLELAIGTRITAAAHFRHNPPNGVEIEEAIQTVEDALFPVRAKLAASSILVTSDEGINRIADLAGLAKATRRVLTREAVERLFGRMAAVAEGRPLAGSGLPDQPDFYPRLLILREFLHHQGFDSISVETQR